MSPQKHLVTAVNDSDGTAARGRFPVRGRLLALVAMLMVGLAAMLGPASASAAFGFVPGSAFAESNAANAAGVVTGPETRAGAVPFSVRSGFELNSTMTPRELWGMQIYETLPDDNVREVVVDMPNGVVGDPNATPRCKREEFVRSAADYIPCPPSSQVGTIRLWFGARDYMLGTTPETSLQFHQYPVYNVEPRKGDVAQFSFIVFGFGPTHLVGDIRQTDFGIRVTIPDISVMFPLVRSDVTLWGVPADPRHDALRGYAEFMGFPIEPGGQTSGATPRAFLRNASVCDGTSPVTHFRARSWNNPDRWEEITATSPPITNCEQQTFNPGISVAPTTTAPDSPSGLDVRLSLPQNDSPTGIGTPPLKRATVTLPPGMTINPAGANGLTACTDAQLRLGVDGEDAACPDASRIGDVSATSPAIDGDLTGGIFVRSQNSSDPESGELFRIAMILRHEERGVEIRLPGSIRADKATGQLVTTFDNNPQLPVSEVQLRFMAGPRAPLATPSSCGTHTAVSTLTSWSGQSVDLNSSFSVDCAPGLLGFAPAFTAGTALPVAGARSPLSLSVTKPDGQQPLASLRMKLPTGLLATLKGRLHTQVGSVTAFAGPGSTPYPMAGRVYLEGPYGDAPFSLRVVVPAVAGPFDLGEVVVRQKIYVDRNDASVRVVSDPIPTVVNGVPVRMQRMDVNIDAPGFMVNPTSCEPKVIQAVLGSVTGVEEERSVRFQVGECGSKPLNPRLSMAFTNSTQMREGRHPGVQANLGTISGDANLKQVEATLPLAVALDPNNARGLCEPADATAGKCPAESIIGHATANTPLLDVPVSGPVFFVKGYRTGAQGQQIATLPKLFMTLSGQGVSIDVWADSSVSGPIGRQRLVTTFVDVPDVPIDDFRLRINGGRNGILKATANVCGAPKGTGIEYTGHNGRVTKRTIQATAAGCRPQVVSSSSTQAAVSVRVGGIGAGRLTLSGPRVATTRRTIRSADAATIRSSLRLTATQRRQLSQGRSVRVAVRVAYRPATGKSVTLRRNVTVQGVKRN